MLVVGLSAAFFLVTAAAIALLVPSERATDPVLIAGIVVGYAIVSRVRFEFGNWYVAPELLLFVPLLLLAPLPYVPLLVAVAAVLSIIPDFVAGRWHRQRALGSLSDSWFSIGPVLVLALLAPGDVSLAHIEVYALAFLAEVGFDLLWTTIRDRVVDEISFKTILDNYVGSVRFDAILAPVAFVFTLAAAQEPLTLLTIGPLVWLLEILSRDRKERYTAALDLQRAYRGTVMLLADVVEFDDAGTASHSRSVVDLVHSVADHLGIDPTSRQELEFAALLHDVGKITIPKQILHKPAALTDEEFELIKTHTIEGQFLLDRVGGLLGRVGEIVRSCHERWDGQGYPDGLSGDAIPLESRIVFACDAYNAMTTNRPYRAAMPMEHALQELTDGSGTQFDERVVRAVIEVVQESQPVISPADEVRSILASRHVATGARASASA